MKNLVSFALGGLLAAVLAFSTIAPAQADAWDNVNNYFRSQQGFPADFTLNKTEFGNNNAVRVVHLGIEYAVATKKGYVLIYKAGTNGSLKVDAVYSTSAEYQVPTQTREMRAKCGPGAFFIVPFGTDPANDFCVLAAQVGGDNSYLVNPEIAAVAPTPRECTIEVNTVGHEHTC